MCADERHTDCSANVAIEIDGGCHEFCPAPRLLDSRLRLRRRPLSRTGYEPRSHVRRGKGEGLREPFAPAEPYRRRRTPRIGCPNRPRDESFLTVDTATAQSV